MENNLKFLLKPWIEIKDSLEITGITSNSKNIKKKTCF